MTVLQRLVGVLDKSIFSPLLVADPCYVQIRNDYVSILEFIAETKDIDIETSVGGEREYLILLAKKEVYMRLAVSVAPEFNMEAEFTKLLKSDRFDHYMGLVKQAVIDIAKAEENVSYVTAGQAVIDTRNGTLRNYNLSGVQAIVPEFVLASNHIDISWNAFTDRGEFSHYALYCGTENFYDEFEEFPIDSNKFDSAVFINDLLRNKYRFKNLSSATPYYILLVFVGKSGRKSYHYSTQVTL